MMYRFLRAGRFAIAIVLLASCVDASPPRDYGDPTSLGEATTQNGITIRLISPRATDVQTAPRVLIELVASTEPASELAVAVHTTEGYVFPATSSGTPGPDQRFTVEVPLLHGSNTLDLRVRRLGSTQTRRVTVVATYEGASPGIRFGLRDDRGGTPCGVALIDDVTARSTVCVRGVVSSGATADVTVALDGIVGVVTRGDDGRSFEAELPLAADGAHQVVATATVAADSSSALRTVTKDSTPPSIVAPLAGTSPNRTSASSVEIAGTAFDANGIAELRLASDAGVVDLQPAETFARVVQLLPGTNGFAIEAVDRAGNTASLPLVVVRDRLIRLEAPNPSETSTLNLDRDAIEELLDLDAQQETEVVQVSLRTAVLETLYAIRDPELFDLDTSGWGPAEWNLHTLLNMTPDNANLEGSSIEELIDIAPAVGLPAPRLLADLLDLDPTETFLSIDGAADVVLRQLIATHPNRCGAMNVTPGACIALDAMGMPMLTLTMRDVLNDLTTADGRFGASGAHPGFIDGSLHSEVLEPGFLMSIPASSNLDAYQGVDASRGGKDYFFIQRPGSDTVLVLDFLSDEFSVVGLVDEPVVDVRFVLGESASFFGVSTSPAGKTAGADPAAPGFHRGNSTVWSTPVWDVERIVAEAAYQQYRTKFGASSFVRTLSYDAGSIDDAAVMQWDRGWVTITTSGGIGNPPPPTYVWDILLETAQLRLHEGGIAEGAADLAFSLDDLSIGLDADGLIEALRPTLSAQADELANRLISPDGLIASGADLYYVPSTVAGPGFLFFRAAVDSSGPYTYPKPGFYSDAALTQKVSSTSAATGTSDTAHEKIAATLGARYFFADDAGVVFELELVAVDAEGVEVRVAPVVGGAP